MSRRYKLAGEDERCAWSDLPRGECAPTPRCDHGGDVKAIQSAVDPDALGTLPVRLEGTWCVAQYAGTCGCGCEQAINVGEDLVKAHVVVSEASTHGGADEVEIRWCMFDHTRPGVVSWH